ncbi:hypothetical protein ACHQM5_008572 [Ranunculus cassubicifolius]
MHHRVRDWDNLPLELVEKIRDSLNLPGLFKFGRICSSWRSSSSHIFKTVIDSSLIIQKDSSHKGFIWIFSPSDGRPYQVQLPYEYTSGKIWGFSKGWIVLEEDDNISDLQLLHLFCSSSASAIHLPPLPPFDDQGSDCRKVCLSSDQSMVMAIHRDLIKDRFNLYFCRPKQDSSWNVFTIPYWKQTTIVDVIFSSGMFYAITFGGVFAVVDPSDGFKTTVIDAGTCFIWSYLAESSDHGVMVVNLATQSKSDGHWIEKIDTSSSTDEAEVLSVINDIGDHAVFVSCHHSQVISTNDFPYFKRNCVYTSADPYWAWAGDVLYYDDRPVLLGGRSLDK